MSINRINNADQNFQGNKKTKKKQNLVSYFNVT